MLVYKWWDIIFLKLCRYCYFYIEKEYLYVKYVSKVMLVKVVLFIYNFYFVMFRKNDGGLYLKFCFVNFKYNLLLLIIIRIVY